MWKQGHACSVRLFPHPYGQQVHRLFLAMNFVRNRELLAAFGAASCEYAATVSGLHAFAESMFVLSFSVVRLECSFHCAMLFFCFLLAKWVCGQVSNVPCAEASRRHSRHHLLTSGCKFRHSFFNGQGLAANFPVIGTFNPRLSRKGAVCHPLNSMIALTSVRSVRPVP